MGFIQNLADEKCKELLRGHLGAITAAEVAGNPVALGHRLQRLLEDDNASSWLVYRQERDQEFIELTRQVLAAIDRARQNPDLGVRICADRLWFNR